MKVLKVVLALASLYTALAGAAPSDTVVSKTTNSTVHIRVDTLAPYEEVKARLEKKIKRMDENIRSLIYYKDYAKARSEVERLAGDNGLIIYHQVNFTGWLPMVNSQKKVMQYEIGNSVYASQMISNNAGAALYAPLRVILYQNDSGFGTFEYDQPTTLFGQLKDRKVQEVAEKLDRLLYDALIEVSKNPAP